MKNKSKKTELIKNIEKNQDENSKYLIEYDKLPGTDEENKNLKFLKVN